MVEPSYAGFDQVREGVAALLIAGRMYRQDPLDEQAALFALGPVTDPTPDHRMPDRPLCEVVGRLPPFVVDEGPEVLCLRYTTTRENLRVPQSFSVVLRCILVASDESRCDLGALARHRPDTEHLAIDQQVFHLDPDGLHWFPELAATESAIPDLFPPVEHLLGLVEQLLADPVGLALHLGEALEVSLQVRPAKLAQPAVDPVWLPAIGDQHPFEGTQKLPCGLLAPVAVDHEHRHQLRRSHPQPVLDVVLPPVRLVGMKNQPLLYMLLRLFDRLGYRLADSFLAGRGDRTQAHLEAEKVLQQLPYRSFAQTTGASQISADGLDTGAECPAGCALRQVESIGVAAAGANQLGLHHPHVGWWNIHVLVAERVLVVELQVLATALFASLRHDLFELVYLFDRNQRSVLRLVARLRATLLLGLLLLAPASLLARRVARRGFG